MKNFTIKPRELKIACQTEHWSHKARIVGFSVLMSSIAGYYQYYFDMMAYRSGQYQKAALTGDAEYKFMDYTENSMLTGRQWSAKQTFDAWKDKSLKELKQINMKWKTDSYQNIDTTVWVNPNGNPKDDKGYYTQNLKFYEDYKKFYNEQWDSYYNKDPVARDAVAYSNWAEMHEDVLWFDTAACWKGRFIGDVNRVLIKPDSTTNTQSNKDPNKTYTTPNAASNANAALNGKSEDTAFGTFWNGWYTGANYDDRVSPLTDYNKDLAYNPLTYLDDDLGPFQR